jgi:hypothetical protein
MDDQIRWISMGWSEGYAVILQRPLASIFIDFIYTSVDFERKFT